MEIQPVTLALPQPTAAAAPAPAVSFQEVVTNLPTPAFDVSLPTLPQAVLPGTTELASEVSVPVAGSTDLQAAVAAQEQDPAVADLQAVDLLAQASLVLQAQQTVLAAMSAGNSDVSLLLSGLPPGATATLLGGGWVRVPPGTDPAEAESLWAFHFPFLRPDVPAVTSPNRPDAAGDQEKHAGTGAPLTVYGPRGEKELPPGPTYTSTVDILD